MKHFWGLIVLSALMLVIITGVTNAQDTPTPQRTGIVVKVDAVEGVGDSIDQLISVIPATWLAPPDGLPRYEIHIVPNVNEIEQCSYLPLGVVTRIRIDIDVIITDLENSQQIGNRHFVGKSPQTCGGNETFSVTSTHKTYFGKPNLGEFAKWLNATLPFADYAQSLGIPLTVLQGEGNMYAANFSPDGRLIATGGNKRPFVTLWDADTGEKIRDFDEDNDGTKSINFSPDGHFIVIGGFDKVMVLDTNTGKELLQLDEAGSEVTYSPDGRMIIATLRSSNGARIYDASTGKVLLDVASTSPIVSVNYSPDQKHIATGNLDGKAHIWDASTGKELLELVGHSGQWVYSAKYSPDGQNVLTASEDQTARVWNTTTGKEQLRLVGHDGGVLDANYSPDGHYIVTASADKTARIWDANTGKELHQLTAHTGGVQRASFSPDGQYVVTASDDGTAIIWDVSDLTNSNPEATPQP